MMAETRSPRPTAADLVKSMREAWDRDEAVHFQEMAARPDPYSAQAS